MTRTLSPFLIRLTPVVMTDSPEAQAAFGGNHISVDIAQFDRTQACGLSISAALRNHHGEAVGAPRITNDRRQGNRQHGLR